MGRMLHPSQFSPSQSRSIQRLAQFSEFAPHVSRLNAGNNPYSLVTAHGRGEIGGMHSFVREVAGLPKQHYNQGELAKATRPLVNRKKRR